MNIIDLIVSMVDDVINSQGNEAELISIIQEKYEFRLATRSPEDRARVLAFIGLAMMDMALADEEDDGSYSAATLASRSIIKATEEVLVNLGLRPDFLATCTQPVHSPVVLPRKEQYDDPSIVWN